MQIISIELQYLHSSIQISFASSEYDSVVFSVSTLPANHQIHAIGIFFVVIFFVFCFYAVQCGPVWNLCMLFRRSPAWKICHSGVAARVEELLQKWT